MSATNRKIDEISQLVSSVRESALRVQYLFLLSTTSTSKEVMDDTLAETAVLLQNAGALTNTSIDGMDSTAIETLAAEAAKLEAGLAKLKDTTSFAEVHQLRRTIKESLTQISDLAANIQVAARMVFAKVQKTAQASAIEQIKVDLVSDYGAELAEQSILVKASTLGLISGLVEATPDEVHGELAELTRIAGMINSAAAKFPEVAKLVEQIQGEITAYRGAFDSMVASLETVETMTTDLGVVANQMRMQVSELAARQAQDAASVLQASGPSRSRWRCRRPRRSGRHRPVARHHPSDPCLTAIMGQLAGRRHRRRDRRHRTYGDEIGAMDSRSRCRDNARERARMRPSRNASRKPRPSARRADTLIADCTQVQGASHLRRRHRLRHGSHRDLTRIAGESAERAKTLNNASGTTRRTWKASRRQRKNSPPRSRRSRARSVRRRRSSARPPKARVAPTRRSRVLPRPPTRSAEVVTPDPERSPNRPTSLALNATIEAARPAKPAKDLRSWRPK
ncbi:MAG: hypothetical protein HPM95_01795 [Alphaproteobacteria bacterium]|nr:hypothetical protein [Alphaproteobacteria bacterium]